MTKQHRYEFADPYQKPSRGDRKNDRRSARRMASDGEEQTGAEQRPASGYPEQNPRREQHQTGGGIDKNEVGNDLEGDWEEEGGDPEDTAPVPPRARDHVIPGRGGPKSIKGLGRDQIRRSRQVEDSRG